jgi:hypothetical protein
MAGIGERVSRLWTRRADWTSVVVLAVIALVAMTGARTSPVHWTPDSLFYRAQLYELRGASRQAALDRSFSGRDEATVARTQQRQEPGVHRVDDPAWVKYSSRLYRRRWLVPAMAAGIYPIAGERSLLDVSMLGYVAAGLLLFALLRRRFSPGVSLAVTAACLLLPPLRQYSGRPLTDSWGLALEIGALLAAVLALERGGRWIAVFVAAMLALSFTRDATVIVLVAVAAVALMLRTRRSAAVLGAGVAASIPAPLLFKVPLVDQISYTLNDYLPAHPASWSFVAHHWPSGIWTVFKNDLAYPNELSLAPLVFLGAAVLVAALVYMLVRAPRDDPYYALQRGAVLGGLLTVAIAVNYTSMRIELVLLPPVAVGLALGAERLIRARQGVESRRPLARMAA